MFVRALGYRPSWFFPARDSVVRLEMLATTLDAVVTTVGQRTMAASEAVASITVIDRAAIDAAAAPSAGELLRRVPGLQEIAAQPSKTGIAIRGLDASRVLVLVDGEPVVGSLIETRDIGRLSTMAAERIEVVKGPSSVEFGSDALGGVINLVTAPPSEEFRADVASRVGAMGRREAIAEVSDTRGPGGYRVSAGWRQTDAVTAIGSGSSALDRVYDLRTTVRYALSEFVSIRTDAQLSRQRQRWPVGAGYNGFVDNHAAQGLAELQAPMWRGTARVRVFAQYSDYQFRQAAGPSPLAGSADSLEQKERLLRALFSFTRPIGDHVFDAGVQASARAIVSPSKIEGDRADDHVLEAFARDRWIRGSFLATAGARVTNGSLWGAAVTPSVGAAWQASDAWRVRANVARGFRAPSFKEIRYTFANPAGGYVVEGNADLSPETSTNTELGITWAPLRAMTIAVDAYTTRVNDLISLRLVSTNDAGFQVYRNRNVSRARMDGVEAMVRIETAAAEFQAGYNYLRARDTDRRSAHTAHARASRTWARLGALVSDVSITYTGEAPIGDATQGALLSLDAQLRLPVGNRMEVSAGANNLLDDRPLLWAPSARRHVFVGIRAHSGS
jgi:outer membrane receptor for ferrienterochelin and colicins